MWSGVVTLFDSMVLGSIGNEAMHLEKCLTISR